MKEKILNNYCTIREYAERCGTSKTAIYLRIKRGIIIVELANNGRWNQQVIDTEKYPPCRMVQGKRKQFVIRKIV